jgi:hypothetical protein
MKRTRDSRTKVVEPRDHGHQASDSMRSPPRPTSIFAKIDAATHHILPEESWFGAEFDSRAAPWEQHYSQADTHSTGAFTVWGPGTVDVPEEDRPYATDASRLDDNVAKGEERQVKARGKFDQLVRHGLVVGDRDRMRPLLALPSVSDREQERRKHTAQRLVDQYVYESSEDDATASQLLNVPRKKPKKGRLIRLQEALAKLEMPSEGSQAGQHGPLTTPIVDNRMAISSVVADEEEDSLPTLGFQKAMRKPSHPDFGMDFTTALRLAMAKEKKAHVMTVPETVWDSDDGQSDTIVLAAPRRNTGVRLGHAAPARPKPQTRHHSFSRAEINAQRKFDIVEYTVAKASEMGGLDFRDERLVDIFNGIMQRDNPRRPIRTQASLLAISYTDPMDYLGEDLQILLENEEYNGQVERAIARLLPDSRLS